ncbi:MAG: FAD-binding oxidoreductase [Candidatus Woesearchaeota archaeon]
MVERRKLHNHSPWIHQLKNFRKRPVRKITEDIEADVAIIGAGIAGIATSFFILSNTNKSVVLLEAGKVAHGATGHNAGQLAPYFERPFSELVDAFGLKMAADAQKDILSAWNLLRQIRKKACMETPLSEFIGYAGCSSVAQLNAHLKNKLLRKRAGINMEKIYVSDEVEIKKIPIQYRKMIEIVPHPKILSMLETNDPRYIAALATQKGVMNSALFCEELAGYLLKKYPGRFRLAERTPVKRITLFKAHALIETPVHKVASKKAVLCTNGFENIELVNTTGSEIDGKFHENVRGLVGFMAGYVEHLIKMPIAISYFKRKKQKSSQAYYYFTRRTFEPEKGTHHTLICAGGPDMQLAEKDKYRHHNTYTLSREMKKIDAFLRSTYAGFPCRKHRIKYKYHWHGLMGYTRTGLRMIGPEPCNPTLFYNLGCNGVGLLSSIFGGYKIAQILNGKKFGKSAFDPQDLRCAPKIKPFSPHKYHGAIRF